MRRLPEEETLCAPITTGVHSTDECDHMLTLGLEPAVADAWLDERLRASQALAFNRQTTA